jgi:hypothetical protein
VTPQRINDYFDKLIARADEASHLPHVAFAEGKPHECHKNADAYAARHPDRQPVHGWLVTQAPGIHMLHAHSAVKRPEGQSSTSHRAKQTAPGCFFSNIKAPPRNMRF